MRPAGRRLQRAHALARLLRPPRICTLLPPALRYRLLTELGGAKIATGVGGAILGQIVHAARRAEDVALAGAGGARAGADVRVSAVSPVCAVGVCAVFAAAGGSSVGA